MTLDKEHIMQAQFHEHVKNLTIQEDFTGAAAALGEWLRSHQNDMIAWVRYGDVLRIRGKLDKAARAYDKALAGYSAEGKIKQCKAIQSRLAQLKNAVVNNPTKRCESAKPKTPKPKNACLTFDEKIENLFDQDATILNLHQ